MDWDAQKAVWDGIFSDEVFGVGEYSSGKMTHAR